VTEWLGREITVNDEVAILASPWSRIAREKTDLEKVGFVFLDRVMLVEPKVVR
jgi:hypothetical protein